MFSIYAAQFCKAGKIFCFEPLPNNFEVLKSNVMKNKLENIFIMIFFLRELLEKEKRTKS